MPRVHILTSPPAPLSAFCLPPAQQQQQCIRPDVQETEVQKDSVQPPSEIPRSIWHSCFRQSRQLHSAKLHVTEAWPTDGSHWSCLVEPGINDLQVDLCFGMHISYIRPYRGNMRSNTHRALVGLVQVCSASTLGSIKYASV